MYDLHVFYPGDRTARHTQRVRAASEVLAAVPELLGVHAGCERIEVTSDEVQLFAVDCAGNTLPSAASGSRTTPAVSEASFGREAGVRQGHGAR